MRGAIGKSPVFERKSRRKKGVMAGLGNERGRELNAHARGAGCDLMVTVETWPIRGGFTISRGAKHEAVVVVASLSDGRHKGRGECVPYARYGESIEAVVSAIAACAEPLAGGLTRADLASLLPAGAAQTLASSGRQSELSATRSLSSSGSQASPRVSPSKSS